MVKFDIIKLSSPPHISWMLSLQNASPDVCRVLVGNKVDAEDERMIDSTRGKLVR